MTAPAGDLVLGPVAVVGAGVIGNGWTAYLLGHGLEVAVYDPDPAAEHRLRDDLDVALAALGSLGLEVDDWENRLRFTDTIAESVEAAAFVQENGPEREDLKSQLLRELDEATRPDVVIASSSSGMVPSQLAAMCPHHPERLVVGHPFNPVYLMPLVEVVAAPGTPAATVDTAIEFYRAIGKRPIHLQQEVPGHLANRLQAALWREAYSLVERGIASVADIDAAISHGPGLRWALLGPLANQHLSGGAGGLAHVLDHLGPPTQRWMDDLGAPQLTPELAKALVAGVEDELKGVDVAAMVAQRDALLITLLTAKSHASDLP